MNPRRWLQFDKVIRSGQTAMLHIERRCTLADQSGAEQKAVSVSLRYILVRTASLFA